MFINFEVIIETVYKSQKIMALKYTYNIDLSESCGTHQLG